MGSNKWEVEVVETNGNIKKVQTNEGETLQEVLMDFDFDIGSSCGGNGTCGTCMVTVVEGGETLSERSDMEIEMVQDRGLNAQERLSCQCIRGAKVKIKIQA